MPSLLCKVDMMNLKERKHIWDHHCQPGWIKNHLEHILWGCFASRVDFSDGKASCVYEWYHPVDWGTRKGKKAKSRELSRHQQSSFSAFDCVQINQLPHVSSDATSLVWWTL